MKPNDTTSEHIPPTKEVVYKEAYTNYSLLLINLKSISLQMQCQFSQSC